MTAVRSIAARSFPLRRSDPGTEDASTATVTPGFRLGVGALVTVLLGLELWARQNNYGLRVVSDTPTYVALLYRLAVHPLHAVNPYFATGSSSHGTPDLQLVALIWRALHGTTTVDPVAAYRLLALAGLAGTLLALHAVFVWVRTQAGSRAAWISVPVLLALLGPAHVIWAGDLSLNGFLYAGYYAQTIALAFALYTLSVLDRPLDKRTAYRLPFACVLVALTLLVHPFTGVVLIALVTVRSCHLGLTHRREWWLGPIALAAGFALASAWPVYPIAAAVAASGLPAGMLLLVALAAPWAAHRLAEQLPLPRLDRLPEFPARVTTWLAWAGFIGVAVLAEWQFLLLYDGGANRLGVYWDVALGRWSFLFAGGVVGIAGLYVLARRGRMLPAAWFVGAYVLGVAGAFGASIPLWYRILLFAQVPLALGVALVAAETRHRAIRQAIALSVALSLVVKLVTLLATSPSDTYFGNNWLQDGYTLADTIPPGPGTVASDPFTSYFVPAATGRSVLTLTPAHLGTTDEIHTAERGYLMLHRLYDGADWWRAALQLYRGGVRYVVVDHSLSLSPATLEQFVAQPPNVNPDGGAERRLLGGYFYRLNRIASLVANSRQYAVYRLDGRRIELGTSTDPWTRDGRSLMRALPAGHSPLASDPLTGYHLNAATGRPVVTLTPTRLRTPGQTRAAERGYLLMHQLYDGGGWWQAAQELYRAGVRYLVVDHSHSLSSATLEQFVRRPPSVDPRGGNERRLLGGYFYRLNRIARLVSESPSYNVYRLSGRRLGVISP